MLRIYLEGDSSQAAGTHTLELAQGRLLDAALLCGHQQAVSVLELLHRQHGSNPVAFVDG